MSDSQWAEMRQDVEVRAWIRFCARLNLPAAMLVRLVRVAFRYDR